MAAPVVSLTGRVRTPEPAARTPETAPRPPTPGAPGPAAAPSASERRLKLVIESAPVSLLISDPESKVLAANRATLVLLTLERLDDIIGKTFDRLVAPEDRARVLAFVAKVCQGESGTLQYDLVAPDGARRTMETHAVPLRREQSAVAAFLGATWDITEKKHAAAHVQQLQQKCDLLEAQRSAERDTWEEGLRQAKAAHEDVANGQTRVQTALSEAEERYKLLAGQWSSERDGLLARVTQAEAQHGHLSTEATAEHEALLAKVRSAEERYDQLAGARTAEHDGLIAAARDAEERQRLLSVQSVAERDGLIEKLRESEGRVETLATQLADQNVQRLAVEQTEREHQAALASRVAEHEQLAKALDERTAQYGQLQQTLDERSAEREQLARTLHERSAEHEQLARTLHERSTEHEQLQKALQERSTEHEQLQKALQERSTEHDRLQTALQERSSEHERLQTAFHERSTEYGRLETALQERSREHEQLARTLHERSAECEQLQKALHERSTERDGLDEALNQVKSDYDAVVGDRIRTQAALAEAEENRGHQAALWGAEREGFMTRLLALEHAQREYQSSLAARTSEKQQLEQAVTLARHRYEELQTESRAEREGLSGHVRELERRALAVADRWQTELAEALLPLKDTSARVERLLNDVRSRRPADDGGWHEHEEKPGEPENPSTTEAAASDGESGEEVAWRF